MKLHHRMLRHFIAASVIVLTSSFLIFELVASDRAMSAYLRYIVQRADSSFLYDKYQNQSIAAHVMRALAAEQSEVSPEQRRAICEAFESANNTHGLNLTAHKYPGLRGTLQTASTDCDTIVEAAALLPAFDQAVEGNRHQDDYGSGLGMAEEKFHYYLDLNDRYVYFYEPVNVEYFAMNNWSFLQSGSIGIDRKDIEKVFTGRTVLSSIYQDQRTKQNVMSLLTPVYVAGQLKGIVLLDINKNNLRNIFYTQKGIRKNSGDGVARNFRLSSSSACLSAIRLTIIISMTVIRESRSAAILRSWKKCLKKRMFLREQTFLNFVLRMRILQTRSYLRG